MAALLQIVFPFPGPFGEAMAESLAPLAHDINDEPGLRWKLWTEAPERHQAGGVYLFDDAASARAYLDKHAARLADLGVEGIEAQVLEVNAALSAITHGPLGG